MIPAYQLSVNSGTPSGMTYTPGQVVAVTAAGAPAGQSFAFWTGDTGVLASATSLATTATLSQPYVSLRAIYQLNTAPAGLTVTPGATQNALSWTALTNAITTTSNALPPRRHAVAPRQRRPDHQLHRHHGRRGPRPGITRSQPQTPQMKVRNPARSPARPSMPTPPPPSAIAGNAQVALSWTANGATSYNVKRSLTSGSATSFSRTPPPPATRTPPPYNGTTYYYLVSAILSGVESGNSGGSRRHAAGEHRLDRNDLCQLERGVELGWRRHAVEQCDPRLQHGDDHRPQQRPFQLRPRRPAL